MERDWAGLGRAMAAGRKALGLSQKALAERIGVTRTPIQAIERGQGFDKITGTMRSYARAIGWSDDAIDNVLVGGDPILAATPAKQEDTRDSTAAVDLPLRIVEELAEGPLLDTTVLDLTRLGSSARMVVVIKGAPDASPEEIRRDLVAWRRAERALRDLEADGSEPPEAERA